MAMTDLRVLVVGDTHGNAEWVHDVILPKAEYLGVTKILQLGDFGFIWPLPNYTRGLDKLSRELDRRNLDMHFLPGNHEDYSKLELLTSRAKVISPEGHFEFRPRLFYTGKVSSWNWNGHRCTAVGGATSIDRRFRISGKSWWPEEALTREQAQRAMALGRTEVLFTHDGPSQVPFSLAPDADSTAHRQLITDVARSLKPRAWFHGHYHEYARYHFVHDVGITTVTSLDRDNSSFEDATTLLCLPSP